jgi:hypothetical protein
MTLKVTPPKAVGRYALLVEYDNSNAFFKTYDDLGSAKNSFHYRRYYGMTVGYILENVDGDWYALYKITPENVKDHAPWQKETTSGGWRSSYTIWRAKPMTRDEYAEWRVAVERERIQERSDKTESFLTRSLNN